jgi:hypothetical protein
MLEQALVDQFEQIVLTAIVDLEGNAWWRDDPSSGRRGVAPRQISLGVLEASE